MPTGRRPDRRSDNITGETAFTNLRRKALREHYDVADIPDDIHGRENAEFLRRSRALAPDLIAGVEAGGTPPWEVARNNLMVVAEMAARLSGSEIVFHRKRRG